MQQSWPDNQSWLLKTTHKPPKNVCHTHKNFLLARWIFFPFPFPIFFFLFVTANSFNGRRFSGKKSNFSTGKRQKRRASSKRTRFNLQQFVMKFKGICMVLLLPLRWQFARQLNLTGESSSAIFPWTVPRCVCAMLDRREVGEIKTA